MCGIIDDILGTGGTAQPTRPVVAPITAPKTTDKEVTSKVKEQRRLRAGAVGRRQTILTKGKEDDVNQYVQKKTLLGG